MTAHGDNGAAGRRPSSDDASDGSRATVDVHLSPHDLRVALEEDVRSGLSQNPKVLSPVWFYDDRGCQLFEEITQLPEYYPTRAERSLLERHAAEISRTAPVHTLVEIGAGSCVKSRVLLDALQGSLQRYVPFDVSLETARVAEDLATAYEDLTVHSVIGDFHHHLDRLPAGGQSLVAFLGGTIGNLRPTERQKFLFDVNCMMTADDHLLLGTDLVKETERLISAYDDAAGVTAQFNRNVLHVLNRELHANFPVNRFAHVAAWNDAEEWIEMRLRSCDTREVFIEDLDLMVHFQAGEDILTEISAKFTPERIRRELEGGDFVVDVIWGAETGDFLLTLAHPYC